MLASRPFLLMLITDRIAECILVFITHWHSDLHESLIVGRPLHRLSFVSLQWQVP
jgi:hypothetical protein